MRRLLSWLFRRSKRPADAAQHYDVIVEMEHPGVLADEKALIARFRNKLRGTVLFTKIFAEMGADVQSLAPCVRRFALTRETDFSAFAEIISTITGVVGVKKGNGPWTMTKSEQRAKQAEAKAIAQEQERKAEASYEKRQRQLAELKQLEEATQKSDAEKYGLPPDNNPRLDEREFEAFLASLAHFEVEAVASYFDIMAGGFLEYRRETARLSGNEVVSFLERTINGPLRAPFQAPANFYEIPFRVEYRCVDSVRRFAHLMIAAGNPTFVTTCYDLYIRA